jgi:dTDP-4-amino-4,6-dideoxy-D-galactose acyltransferase
MSDAPCTFLPWDTNFFGKRIARVNGSILAADRLPVIDAWCVAEQIDCLYFLADSADALTVRLAEESGFRLQDIRLTLALTKPAPGREILPELTDTLVNIRASRPDDLEKLHDTARHAYVHTRFYNDPHFTREQCAALYDTWLARSINERAYADITFIADVDDMPAGYVACHLNHDTRVGVIGLVGVAETARGQSMGQKLVLHALRWFWQQGMAEVQVTTQGRNIAGQRLYQRCGFLTQSMLLWYHRWSADTK